MGKFCIIVWFTLMCSVYTKDLHQISVKEVAIVDDLIKRIRADTWHEEESPCLEKTLAYLNNVKNLTLWATWIWEANQNPIGNLYGSTYQMGNFDQCMNPPWLVNHPELRTQYCTAELQISDRKPEEGKSLWDPYDSTEDYINTPSKYGIYMNKLHWGVCVAASCRPRSVVKLLQHMYSSSHYGTMSSKPNITVDFCQVAGAKQQYPMGFYVFIATIVLLLITALTSTIYQSKVNDNKQNPGSIETIISKAFCMKRNYNQLTKANAAEIHVMNGMRFLTSSLIVMLHQIFYLLLSPVKNPFNIEKDLEGLPGLWFLHLDIIVDTFFAMSGLLHVRSLMSNPGRQKNLVSILWKRYLRLLGPLAVTIFYLTFAAKHISGGPFWPKLYSDETAVCAKNWRLSLLMLNTNFEELCHIVTWYIACEYQLAILGTVLCYFYQKDKRLGYTAFGVAAVLSILVPGVITYWHRLPAMPFPSIRAVMDIRHRKSLNIIYTKSYVRANAYLVGIAMGYFMSVFKPADHRRTISTKWSLIGTIGCVVLMQSVMGLGNYFNGREYNAIEVASTVALNRPIWAFAVCCIIAFCEYGTVPIIGDFLSLPAFMPLSRLAYGIYVIHPFIIQRNNYSARTPLKCELFAVVTDTLGTVATSACLSFAMWLLVEAPCVNLSNSLFVNKTGNPEPLKKKSLITEDNKTNGIILVNETQIDPTCKSKLL